MILAQYTIRAKQDYIFKTNRIVEIVGASKIISDVWNDLFKIAYEKGFTVIRNTGDNFDYDSIKAQQKENTLTELFQGGGNLTVLYDSEESFVNLNKSFSFFVIKERPGMIPMAVCTEVTGDYKADYSRLMEKSEIEKNRMNPGRDRFILPFSKMDRETFLPIAGEFLIDGPKTDISYESAAKRKTGIEIRNNSKSVKFLDEMVTKKKEESLLAVVHADGNNMGRKIMHFLADDSDYGSCVSKMRKFTKTTAEAFSQNGLKAMEKCHQELMSKNKNKKLKEGAFAYRITIADGDDFTFICNARFAMNYTRAYLNAVNEFKSEWKYSSCAGICIFHSHYPFSKAYSLAEQACDDGAKAMVHDINGDNPEEGWVDFHYIHSGAGGDLSVIRHNERTMDAMARPWLVTGPCESERHYDKLTRIKEVFGKYDVPRSAVKEIGSSWESSKAAGKQTLIRICGKNRGLEENLKRIIPTEEQLLRAIYDLSEIYDLWFEEVRDEPN